MYPVFRLSYEMFLASRAPAMALDDVHVSHHRCWPWDVDFQLEMNNGRILTLYDLGRIPAALRVGLIGVMRKRRWSFAMAGASVRYRRRLRTFERFTMTTKLVARDERFFYIVQTMWKQNGEAASNILYRSVMVGKDGMVPCAELLKEMGRSDWNPDVPGWIQAWIDAEDTRPWPPETQPEGMIGE